MFAPALVHSPSVPVPYLCAFVSFLLNTHMVLYTIWCIVRRCKELCRTFIHTIDGLWAKPNHKSTWRAETWGILEALIVLIYNTETVAPSCHLIDFNNWSILSKTSTIHVGSGTKARRMRNWCGLIDYSLGRTTTSLGFRPKNATHAT